MKVNRVYKVVRPMRRFGNLIKDIFMPKQSNHFWIRVKEVAETQEEKEEQIFAIIELLNDRIDIKIAGSDHFSFSGSSGDTVIKPLTDAKDIIFQQ